jgi:hypothetical protein
MPDRKNFFSVEGTHRFAFRFFRVEEGRRRLAWRETRNSGESVLSLAGRPVGWLSVMARLLRGSRGRLISTMVGARAA